MPSACKVLLAEIRKLLVGLRFDIVGGSYQSANNQKMLSKLVTGDELFLIREPNNRHDGNAFYVSMSSEKSEAHLKKVGYMPASIASKISGKFDTFARVLTKALHDSGSVDVKPLITITLRLDRGDRGFYTTVDVVKVDIMGFSDF